MALTNRQQWWIRAGGNQLNGGGFDSTISGAGTNYADQDSPQVSVTDFACLNNTTLTSATASFTSQMVGNIVRIASGTNFTAGYYCITAFTNSTTVTIDRNPTTGANASAGVGRIGGAHAGLINYSNGGEGTAPTIATPLAAGHIINIRGAGTRNPSSADYTLSAYYLFPAGDTTNGYIQLIAYNGRVRIDGGQAMLFELDKWKVTGLVSVPTGTTYAANGIVYSLTVGGLILTDCKFDQAGNDMPLVSFPEALFGCTFINSGSTSAGTSSTINTSASGLITKIIGCWFENQRCNAVTSLGSGVVMLNTVIYNCRATATAAVQNSSTGPFTIWNCTIDSGAYDAINIDTSAHLVNCSIGNNVLTNNGAYGIRAAAGAAALNDRIAPFIDYNGYYNNTSGPVSGISQGAHDVTLTASPYTTAGSDFTLNSTAGGGAAAKDVAFPTALNT